MAIALYWMIAGLWIFLGWYVRRHWAPIPRAWVGAALVPVMIAGCASEGEEGARTALKVEREADQVPILLTRLLVVQDVEGKGNPLWTPLFAVEVIRAANALLGGAAALELVEYATLPEAHLYVMSQAELLTYARARWREHGMLTLVISAPDTPDSAGRSAIEWAMRPLIVMRSRDQVWRESTARETALILLHELGHQMGLRHSDDVRRQVELTTDDYHRTEAGREYLAQYVEALDRDER